MAKFSDFGAGGALGSKLTLFKGNLLRFIGGAAKRHVHPSVHEASKTLGKALTWKVSKVGPRVSNVIVGVPHYWAIFLHQGRHAFNMPTGKMMIWWRNPDDDPRLKSFRPGWPIERQELPSLHQVISKADLSAAIDNDEAVMWGGVGGTHPNKFLTTPMESFSPVIDMDLKRKLDAFIVKNVTIRDSRTFTINLNF